MPKTDVTIYSTPQQRDASGLLVAWAHRHFDNVSVVDFGSKTDKLRHTDIFIGDYPVSLRMRKNAFEKYGEVTLTKNTECRYFRNLGKPHGYVWAFSDGQVFTVSDVRSLVARDPCSPAIFGGGYDRSQTFCGWRVSNHGDLIKPSKNGLFD